MRQWIDPPSGWMYGFPKIWDSINDPPVPEWLVLNGYPEGEPVAWLRSWYVDEEEDDDD